MKSLFSTKATSQSHACMNLATARESKTQSLYEEMGGTYTLGADGMYRVEGFYNEAHQVFRAEILEIHDGYYLVKPVEGSWELSSADRIEVPIRNAHTSPEPEVGDVIEIEYSGEILETYPARIADVYGIKVVEETDKFYLTIGAEGVKSIELSMPYSSGGCGNTDGSLFKKGERIWLENLDGYSDLRGLTITALGEDGEIIWTASVPDGEENKGFTHLVIDDWEITNIE